MEGLIEKIISGPLSDLAHNLIKFLPNFLTAILLLIIGFFAGWVIKFLAIKVFAIFKADEFCRRIGIDRFLEKGGIKESPARLTARVLQLLVVIIFSIMALYASRVPAVENLLEKFFLYLPNIFVAALIIVVGYALSNFLERTVLIASVNAGIKFSSFIGKGVKIGVLVLILTMALEQLGIGRDTVIVTFAILFGGIVFSLSLAFGLAGKDLAREYLEKRFKSEAETENEIKHV